MKCKWFEPTETDVAARPNSSVHQYSLKQIKLACKKAKTRKDYLEMALNALETAEVTDYTPFLVTTFASYDDDMNRAIQLVNNMLLATLGEISALQKLAEMRKKDEVK